VTDVRPHARPADLDELASRLLVHLDEGTTDSADSTMTVPVADYLDADRWAREVEALFRRSPVVTALTAHLREPGSYRSIDIAGVPVLTVRQADGGVKAFVNVCRHRGALVVEHGCGSARRFTCPYHAWSYDTTGELVGVSGRQKFGDLDESTRGLTELPCEERHGFVFAIVDPAATLDLDTWLAGYGHVLESLGLESMEFVAERELVGPNWKVAYDGYVDGYHLDILHRDTLGKDVLGNVMTCDAWGPHQRIAFARRNTHELADVPRDEWDAIAHLALVVTVFPHVSVAGNTGSAVMVSQLFPGPTPDRSRTVQTHLVVGGADTEARETVLKRADFLEYVVTEEDYKTGLGIQSGLASGGNTEFVFGRNEPGNQRFHQWVARLADS
jgi:phenylpropionate dioxygenase-like ring-hydroxylating dioxygenase large terminal subunit